ncbi:tRNA dimethylallyltransferase-like isoform X2 [Anneissia japonica]|uniref:tRNA dimethylallyltransferase-like isoform X2 n=1 Tax=Anneissia japonica TaxID=1529436 RepID=UPI0014259EB7|nr:tRNA dimethylallyltransferase-like isoform X2 [Anneissia japonica]
MHVSKMLSRVCPTVVVVLGATGAGKSKLALDIATRMNSEIISADSMQVYKGLDIITNKVTAEELKVCPHHLIDYVNPLSRYTVVDFRNKAVPIIDNILKNDKLAIIVGGTNYYIEALLWNMLLDPVGISADDLLLDRDENKHIQIRKRSPPDDLAPIKKHPRIDSRETKETESDFCKNSKDVDTSHVHEGNHSDLCIEKQVNDLWGKTGEEVTATDSVKDTTSKDFNKISIENKLYSTSQETVESPKTGVAICNPIVSSPDSSSGGSILNRDVKILNQDLHIDVEKLSSEELHDILKDVDPVMANKLHPNNRRKIIRSLKVMEQHHIPHSQLIARQQATEGGGPLGGPLRYPNVCIFWVQSNQTVLDERLNKRVDSMMDRGLLQELSDFHVEYNQQRIQGNHLKGPGVNVPPIYGLDASDPTNWNEMVVDPAVSILSDVIRGTVPTVEPLACEKRSEDEQEITFVCSVCNDRIIVGKQQWKAHLKSRGHLKRARKVRKYKEELGS